MGLLSPFMLAAAAALAVPLWLHLRRRRRQTPVEFPSLRYLKLATSRMKRQAKVENLGLLLLRLLLLALLAAAFARPVVRGRGAWLGAGRAVEAVVVLDATASMGWRGEAGTRLDASKRLAREWIESLDATDAVALWVLTDRLEQPVPVPVTARGQVLGMLDAVTVSEGSSGLAPAFTAAREWAATRSTGRKELVVITDNQPAAWDWPAAGFFRSSWNRSNTNLTVLSPDAARPPNISVTSVTWDARTASAGALLSGMARLVNCSGAAVTDLLECRIGGQVLLRKPVEIPAGGSLDVPLALPVPATDEAVLAGEVALAGDALACDDRWHFALPVRQPMNALVVDRNGGAMGGMRASHFLTRALTAGGAGKATAIESDAWLQQATAGIDSIWFTAGAVSDAAAWAKALAYAEAGGTMIVTADAPPDPLPKDWPVSTGEELHLPAGRMATRLLAPAHFLFDGVWSEQTAFPSLPQKTARRCAPAGGARVLATLAGELPLLVEAPRGRGRVYWLNASADRTWGDLPLSPAYVPLVQQLARARALAVQTATTCWVGEAWPDLAGFAGDAAWPAADDGTPHTRVTRSGLYPAVSSTGQTVWRCAVNVRRAESDLRPVAAATLQAMLPGRVAAGPQGIREWREESRREVPLWPWLLAAAALVFLLEGRASALAASRREPATGSADISRFFNRR
ncbi:MAG: VWA domain-containing protein [Verrucomicrobiota bacterium]